MDINFLLENRINDDVDGMIMTTSNTFEGGHVTKYLGPIYVGVNGNLGDIDQSLAQARNMLAAKARKLNADAIIGFNFVMSRSSWTTEEFSGDTYHDSGCTFVAYGTPVNVKFDDGHEGRGPEKGDGSSKSFLSQEEKNRLFARRTIMEGLKGERDLSESSMWKLLCKFPSGEYKDLVVDFLNRVKNPNYGSLVNYLKKLIPVDKDAAIEIAHSLPSAIYDDPATKKIYRDWSICLEICKLGLFDARRVCALVEKGEIITAVRLVEAYTRTGFNGGGFDAEKNEDLHCLSQMLNTAIDGIIAGFEKELKDLEDDWERFDAECSKRMDAEEDWKKRSCLSEEHRKYDSKISSEKRSIKDSLSPYGNYKKIMVAYDSDVAFLESCLKEKELTTKGME